MSKYDMVRTDSGTKYWHRLVWESAHGPIPNGMQIDHINGDKRDNRLENLRCVTNQQNCYNHKDVKGFSYDKRYGRWKAVITHNYKTIFLGYHDTIIDARAAYLRKYRELLGADFNGRA